MKGDRGTDYSHYGRRFFIDEKLIAPQHREAVEFFFDQARKFWLKRDRQSQGHLAIALKRFGDKSGVRWKKKHRMPLPINLRCGGFTCIPNRHP